jgi:hypothetical protein
MGGTGRRREIALVNHFRTEVSMTGRCWGSRGRWLRGAFVATAAIAAVGIGGSAQAAPVHAGPVTLAGFTSQHFPVFFKVSSDGRMLLTGGIGINMTCKSGATLAVPDAFAHVSIHPDGRLHAAYTSPTILTNGTAYSGSDSLTAKLNPKHSQLSGTWELAVNYTLSDGTTDQCESGPVRFSATA